MLVVLKNFFCQLGFGEVGNELERKFIDCRVQFDKNLERLNQNDYIGIYRVFCECNSSMWNILYEAFDKLRDYGINIAGGEIRIEKKVNDNFLLIDIDTKEKQDRFDSLGIFQK